MDMGEKVDEGQAKVLFKSRPEPLDGARATHGGNQRNPTAAS